MRRPPSQQDKAPDTLLRRLDRGAGELNLFLVVLAIGLAVLDVTCFTALQLHDLPAIAHIGGSIPGMSRSAQGAALTQ